VDINLDTLKGEILDYLEAGNFAVFHSTPGGLEGMPLVVWNADAFPDYQMFLETAKVLECRLILFATSEFAAEEIDAALEELESCGLDRDERRDLESRLNDLRPFAGVTCSLEMAYDYQSRYYVYEVRPDWYEDFLTISDEIDAHLPTAADDDNGSLGGYFSKN
jgi:hypothetical protein